jgi:hypothetical protein
MWRDYQSFGDLIAVGSSVPGAFAGNRAACYYFGRSRSSPSEQLPRVSDGTVYEVHVQGESIVHRVEHRRMLEWVN